MSKCTKIIAALGVVAGLGVAALPAFTYATGELTGDVDLYVEVDSAIAMTITGNNDSTASGHLHQATGDPSATTENHGPANRAQPDGAFGITANTNVSSSKIENMLPNSFGSTFSTVTVYTNNPEGYSLTLEAETPALTNEAGDTIAANVITETSGTPDVGLGYWSFKTDTSEYDATTAPTIVPSNTWTAATTAAKTLRNTDAADSDGDATVVTYGVSTSATQPTGVYKTTLTYTAAMN